MLNLLKSLWTILAVIPTIALNLCNVVLTLINTVVLPISDMTPTNKDNAFCAKVSGFIENKAIPFIGKLQTWLNKLGL